MPSASAIEQTPARVVAADALDARTVGALIEACVETSCHDRLEISRDGGVTWRIGPVMPRYGAQSRLIGLVAIDAQRWFAYGSSGWFTSDAGLNWHRIRDGLVSSAGRAGGNLWVVRNRCPPGSWCRSWIDVLSPAGAVVRHSDVGWLAQRQWVDYLLWSEDTAYAVIGSQSGGRIEVLNHALVPLASRTLPAPGVGSLVRNGVRLDLLNSSDPAAGTQPKRFWSSLDGGRTWQRRPDPILRGYAVSLQAPRPGLLWRYGYRSEIWRSTDDGLTWKPLLGKHIGDAAYELQAFTSYGSSAWAFAFIDDGPALGVFITTDAGNHWRPVWLP